MFYTPIKHVDPAMFRDENRSQAKNKKHKISWGLAAAGPQPDEARGGGGGVGGTGVSNLFPSGAQLKPAGSPKREAKLH